MTKKSTGSHIRKPRLIVIVGPTATGKSDLAVSIAQACSGEIISADSRQVYKGLDLGTGKITKKEMKGIPHHLLDVVSPRQQFSVAQWQTLARKKIQDIVARGNIPIIVGGTGFYIQSIVDNIVLPEVPPNKALRKKLSEKKPVELFTLLQKLDPLRAGTIDQHNQVRLIRAIEIALTLGAVPAIQKSTPETSEYDILQIGLIASPDILKQKIEKRLALRLKAGMIAEAQKLHANGLSYTRMRQLGLEYGYLADFLQKKISKEELSIQLARAIYQYTRRQIAWFKRDKRIEWIDISKDHAHMEALATSTSKKSQKIQK